MSVPDGIERHIWRDRVARDSTLFGGVWKTAHVLSGYVHSQKGFAWPTTGRLASDLGFNERTVRRHINTLVKRGYLDVERKGRRGPTNEYRLRLPDSQCETSAAPDKPVRTYGHSAPVQADTNVRQTIEESIENPLERTVRKPPSGLSDYPSNCGKTGEHKSGDSKRATHQSLPVPLGTAKRHGDRGKIEILIMQRLGADGVDILSALPDGDVQKACDMQRANRLSDAGLLELRQKALLALSPSERLPSSTHAPVAQVADEPASCAKPALQVSWQVPAQVSGCAGVTPSSVLAANAGGENDQVPNKDAGT